jgi:hypothetical protein
MLNIGQGEKIDRTSLSSLVNRIGLQSIKVFQ